MKKAGLLVFCIFVGVSAVSASNEAAIFAVSGAVGAVDSLRQYAERKKDIRGLARGKEYAGFSDSLRKGADFLSYVNMSAAPLAIGGFLAFNPMSDSSDDRFSSLLTTFVSSLYALAGASRLYSWAKGKNFSPREENAFAAYSKNLLPEEKKELGRLQKQLTKLARASFFMRMIGELSRVGAVAGEESNKAAISVLLLSPVLLAGHHVLERRMRSKIAAYKRAVLAKAKEKGLLS